MAKWTEAQKKAASERMKAVNENKKTAAVSQAMRIPVGGSRNVTAVNDTPDGYVDRWVNDKPGRIDKFKRAGYENVQAADIGDSGVDATHAQAGVVSREMGQGITAYLMRQRKDYFKDDQKAKQLAVDATEDSIRRDVKNKLNDGHYGGVTIDRR
jgi:hypothetical protein